MRRNRQSGSVSMYALLTMFTLLTASLGVCSYALNSLVRASQEKSAVVAFQAAQAGLEHTISHGFGNLEANKGNFVNTTLDLNPALSTIAPNATASGFIQPSSDATYSFITATAKVNGVRRSVRVYAMAKNVGIWNNAIFAGTGASGQAINGNVDIRGSVHMLGDGEAYSDLNHNGKWDPAEAYDDKNKNGVWDPGEPFTDTNGDGVWNSQEPYNDANGNGIYDPPLTQTDLDSSFGGTAYIGNNYSGMPVGLEGMVPAPPRPGGTESLSAEVRVKHGRISIGGSATIGTSAVIDGGTSKNTIDGSYVSDGYTGNQGAASVFSDNGTKNAYDLGNLGIQMPLISGIGAQQYTDTGGTVWNNEHDFLQNRSLTVPVTSITSTTPAFSYGPDAYGNKISFTPASGATPATIDVTGIIRFNGDLQIGAKDSISYKGNGSFFTEGNMYIDGNLTPAAGYTFPTTARMGFISNKNMYLATGAGSSQLTMAGAFYAQGMIKSAKQNQIAGTFVANFFDMGTNVPNIYQVPSLPQNMPPGMPGDRNYYTIKVKSWRERPVSNN